METEATFKQVLVSERNPDTSQQYHTDKGYCQYDRFTQSFRLNGTNDFVYPTIWFERQPDNFDSMADTALKYINKHHHPHTLIIVTPTCVEVLESFKSTGEVLTYIK